MTEQKLNRNPGEEGAFNQQAGNKTLVLHNDDVHTFEYVIDALMEVCGHEYFQASQCATITHYKGKCDVKQGNFSSLRLMRDALATRELTVTID